MEVTRTIWQRQVTEVGFKYTGEETQVEQIRAITQTGKATTDRKQNHQTVLNPNSKIKQETHMTKNTASDGR